MVTWGLGDLEGGLLCLPVLVHFQCVPRVPLLQSGDSQPDLFCPEGPEAQCAPMT